MITRRHFTGAALAAGFLTGGAGAIAAGLGDAMASLEHASGGRLGVAFLNTVTGTRFAYRGDERFPLCSTFKMIAAAAVLARVDAGAERLERRLRFTAADVVPASPVAEAQADGAGMTLRELCDAALTRSDNTAANLLLSVIGGPAGLTAFARRLGDGVTRLDRIEPDLNAGVAGDPRDTTSPRAMLEVMRRLVLGEALRPASRLILVDGMIGNRVGGARLRAGVPGGWRVADRTGTADTTANDIAVIWPPHRPPLLMTAYLTGTPGAPERRDATLAAVARALSTAS